MRSFQTFIFDSYSFNPEEDVITLNFSLDGDLHFTETILLQATSYPSAPLRVYDRASKLQAIRYDNEQLNTSLQALHLIAGISYFKTCLPKQIAVHTGSLTAEQASFWNTVYEKGLGEFFYRNQIDFRGLIDFPRHEKTSPHLTTQNSPLKTHHSKLLVPIGGGKDSTVTIELLKKAGFDITLLRIGRHPLIEQTASIAGLPLLTVERRLDPLLFRLNANGALNGHVPITAYLSFLSVVIAELCGFNAVIMSNERSADEGNVEYLGEHINHQWSKSLECERLIQSYLRGIGSPVQYFSLLRPLSELHIAKMFSALPQYFSCTTSCNANWKLISQPSSPVPQFLAEVKGNRELGNSETERGGRGEGRWCGHCPKCAFVFAMFAAFLPLKTLLEVFGSNLFDEPALQPLYRQLLGQEGFKPFECVGTPEETKAAFLLAHERGDLEQTAAMQLFLKAVLPTIRDPKKLIADALQPSTEHCIPAKFLFSLPSSESLIPNP